MATISDKPVTKPEKAGQALGDSRGARSAFFVGVMRYRAVCIPAFAARWFPDGVTGAALAAAPVVVYDEKADLQDGYLRRHGRASLRPRHHIPATHEFGQALQLGLGWGMLPTLQLAQLQPWTLRPLTPSAHLDVPQPVPAGHGLGNRRRHMCARIAVIGV